MRPSNALTSTMWSAAPSRFVTTWSRSDSSGPGRPDLCSMWHAWTTACKKLCPNPPNRSTRPQKGRWHTSQVKREMSAKQAARQHRAEPRGILAIFGKKCTMHDVGWARDQATSRGSENTQPSVTDQLELSNALTSTQCCPPAVSSATRGTHQSLRDPKNWRRSVRLTACRS